ncbi:MAG TPA: DUF882 domain-containing protein [Terriglobales bacterium]|nr:DUF882 domain-containing protein [Terriglobales bacterium]
MAANRYSSCCAYVILLVVGILCWPPFAGSASLNSQPEYRLRLRHLHTNEQIDLVYRRGDDYIPEAMDRLDRFLRDHRTGTIYRLDPRLFDLLHDLSASLAHPESEIDIVCGYRSPWSNEFLRHTTYGVASHSLHMQGEAIDIRIPGVATSKLRDVALSLHRGGVGYYPKSEFVHVDVGRIRRWQH